MSLPLAARGLFTGHEIEWLPIWVGNVWRLMLFLLCLSLLTQIIRGWLIPNGYIRTLPSERRVAWACVALFTLRSLVTSIMAFDAPIAYEGIPITTAAVILGLLALRRITPPEQRERRRPLTTYREGVN